MWRANDNESSQPKEGVRRPSLTPTDWDATSHPQAWITESPEDVSPRSQGEIPLDNGRADETKKKAAEGHTRAVKASLHCDTAPKISDPAWLTEATKYTATGAAKTQASGNSVSPELLKELRKIIREEFEQLSKEAVKDPRDEDEDHTPRPPAARERPSSPIKPFVNTEGVVFSSYPPKTTIEKRPSSTPSPTTGQQQRTTPKSSTVRFSDETKPAVPDPYSSEETRKPPVRAGPELTTIDKKWGVLFEKDGSHTKRMEHVVRGLANYIVEEFIPQKSIVIIPEKMAAFYSHHRLEKECFPFANLFGSRRSSDLNEALGRLYMDLGCQYFLVQADGKSLPTIPGLTPQGFVHWLTTMIQAYPDEEAKRLDKVVSALPLEADSLLDGKAERLPKQISRYLFPDQASRKTRRLVDEAMNDFKSDIEGSSASQSKGATTVGAGRPAPIIVTAASDKRASMNATGVVSHARYVPESTAREAQGGEPSSSSSNNNNNSSHKDRRASTTTTPSTTANSSRGDRDPEDRSRRNPMPPLPTPHKATRPTSVDINGRSTPIREAWGAAAPTASLGRTSSVASARKNRSPQRNPYSHSTPSGLDRSSDHGGGGERFHGSAGASALAAAAENAVVGVSVPIGSAQNLAVSPQAVVGKGLRDAKNAEYPSQQYRDKRPSLDESASRYKSDHDGSGSGSGGTSRSSKRRSMLLPDTKGPTWDEYLKSTAVLGGTPTTATKRDSRHHSAN